MMAEAASAAVAQEVEAKDVGCSEAADKAAVEVGEGVLEVDMAEVKVTVKGAAVAVAVCSAEVMVAVARVATAVVVAMVMAAKAVVVAGLVVAVETVHPIPQPQSADHSHGTR